MHPQHTAIMVEPDEVSSSTPCSSSASAAHSHHSRSVRPPAGASAACSPQQAPTVCKECQEFRYCGDDMDNAEGKKACSAGAVLLHG